MSNTTWRVSLSEPLPLSRVAPRKIASAGHSRVPASGAAAGTGGGRDLDDGAPAAGAGSLLEQPLQHAARILAAGDAQVELGLLALGDGLGIGLAQVAALAAVLLRHGGVELARQRLAVRQRHALGDRHGGVVPGRAVILGSGQRVGGSARKLAGRLRAGRHVEREQAREEAVEPGTLLLGERRAGGDHRLGGGRRGELDRHAAAASETTPSTIALSAFVSWRRVKVRKVSSPWR